MEEKLHKLKSLLARVHDLETAAGLLSWDQETYMPAGGAEARAEQVATLGRLAHEFFTSEEIGNLLVSLEPYARKLEYDSNDASLVRVTRRDYDRAIKLPSELVAEIARTGALARQVWKEAKETSNFSIFRPYLEKIVELCVQKAQALGYEDRIYDALLDEYEPGMKASRIEKIFADLKTELVSIVGAISVCEKPDDSFFHKEYGERAQWDFGIEVIKDFGFDLNHGRQDVSAHPFTTAFSIKDVRLTTRIQKDYLPSGLFSTLHECGHGLYQQGFDLSLERTPLAGGASLGVHESQSRLWENLIGRSRLFWNHYYPRLKEIFPTQLKGVSLEQFYQAINRVEPSLIRVEADEATYNLHIMLRFELENALLEGRVKVKDLPKVWNAKMEEYLHVVPPNDGQGVLQDIHWSQAYMGYFPTYSLGNLMSAQLFQCATQEIPSLPQQIGSGQFRDLLDWLQKNVHRHGRKLTMAELLQRITGKPLEAQSYLAYIREKYSDIYGDLS
ncbi:MAG: carboxypeptidase [Candidatus Fraserbacteria bacterium RBG_16_55_9]|uniref:Metal-dependent carboxypeptidase n=1 Tax=Fraserbacteria sp. (strain RBG_16_55_9) TaxID=1817864 RepID=A0A1F5UWY5_FRAXR|nr:MAG: carboxypeptidase [Candidatus Fraserbacteria bacterium RBG_16_55_9]